MRASTDQSSKVMITAHNFNLRREVGCVLNKSQFRSKYGLEPQAGWPLSSKQHPG